MSSYEDYTRKSGNYDKTREPVGTEILVGCFAHAPVPLDRTVVLDAGCGTGSYSDALLGYLGRIEAVDLNPGMLEVAARKLAWAGDRVSFHASKEARLRRSRKGLGMPYPLRPLRGHERVVESGDLPSVASSSDQDQA